MNSRTAAIIGAGFFGCYLASHLSARSDIKHIYVIDKNDKPLSRASINNQSRIHGGYHYPRSITTALASSRSYKKFKATWPKSVFSTQHHVYGVAKHGSQISARQFQATMRAIGAPLAELKSKDLLGKFNLNMFDGLFLAEEDAFNALELRAWAQEELSSPKISYLKNESVISFEDRGTKARIKTISGIEVEADLVFNVTYSGIETIDGLSLPKRNMVEYELTEMPLVNGADFLLGSLTVMDGPFFSLMPYPSRGSAMSISHVTHTPLARFTEFDKAQLAYLNLANEPFDSNFQTIKRQAALFVPELIDLTYVDSIIEIKTILTRSADDDSRPILFCEHKPGKAYSVLGGKIDNVFDMVDFVDREVLT